MGDATGERKDRESTVSCQTLFKKGGKEGYTSIQDRFLRCPIYRQSQLNIGWTEDHCKRLDEIADEDHSYVATAAERARRENTWVFVLNSFGPNGPGNQREDYVEGKKTCQRPHQESGQAHHRLHHRIQVFERDQANHLLGTTKVRSASTRRQAGSGTSLSKHQVLLPQDGNRLRGGCLLHGHRHQSGSER